MGKYIAVYKCPLCGQMLKYGEPQEVHYNDLPKFLGMFVNNQLFAGNPYLNNAPMHIPCKCKDGSAGLAAFAGFLKV